MGLRKSGGQERLHEVVEREYARDRKGLIAQLKSPDAEQRRWAARDLAGEPGAAAQLGACLADEREPSVRDVMFSSLGTIGTAAAAQALLPLLRSEDAAMRNGAIETLASMPEAVAPRIDALLVDADTDVRIFVVNLLSDLRHPKVSTWLLRVLAADPSVNVVAAAIEVLAETGEPSHIAALKAAQARFADDAFIGFATEMAIGRIQAP